MTKDNSTNEEAMRKRMLTEPIPRLIAGLAVPTTMIQIVSVIYNTADTYFVAHLGKSAAAAVGVGFSLLSIIQAVGMGFGMGAGSMISRQLGAKKDEDAYKNANSALAAAIFCATVLSVIGLLKIDDLMRILGSSETMLSYSSSYARYILIGCPVMCASLVLNIVLRSEGNAKHALIGITTGGVLNIFLDPLFIYTFDLGIAGAAIATSLCQCISCCILLMPFLLRRSLIKINPKYISKDASDYVKIIQTGSPTICRQGLASIASALLNRRARIYGDAAVAAVTIANKIYLLIRNIVLGIGQAFQPVAGYNYGAGSKKRTREAFNFACLCGTVICSVSAVLIFFNAEYVISWFQTDADVVSMGKTALYFACAAMPFMAYSTYVDQLYQCLGFAKVATFLACSRQGIMFIPAIILLPSLLGLTGVQMAQPMADILSFLLCMPYQIMFFRKQLNLQMEIKAGDGNDSRCREP